MLPLLIQVHRHRPLLSVQRLRAATFPSARPRCIQTRLRSIPDQVPLESLLVYSGGQQISLSQTSTHQAASALAKV